MTATDTTGGQSPEDHQSVVGHERYPEIEYNSLREVVGRWQTHRFTVVGGSVAFVAALTGWLSAAGKSVPPQRTASIPLAFLATSCFLTALCSRQMTITSTYLEVFHDGAWERRLREFLDRHRFYSVNTAFALVYSMLALFSASAAFVSSSAEPKGFDWFLFAAAVVIMLASIGWLWLGSYPRERSVRIWRGIATDEKPSA